MKRHYHKIKTRLQEFRQKQVEFGKLATERALARERQKLELEELKTKRKLLKSKALHSAIRARAVRVKHAHAKRLRPNYSHAKRLIRD